MSDRWINVGSQSKFSEGLHVVTVGKRRVVVARLQGELFAFDSLCPHAQGPMECAEIEGLVISCPLHAWRLISTGWQGTTWLPKLGNTSDKDR